MGDAARILAKGGNPPLRHRYRGEETAVAHSGGSTCILSGLCVGVVRNRTKRTQSGDWRSDANPWLERELSLESWIGPAEKRTQLSSRACNMPVSQSRETPHGMAASGAGRAKRSQSGGGRTDGNWGPGIGLRAKWADRTCEKRSQFGAWASSGTPNATRYVRGPRKRLTASLRAGGDASRHGYERGPVVRNEANPAEAESMVTGVQE